MTGLFKRLFGKKDLHRQALIKELKCTYESYIDGWWITVAYTFKRDKGYWDEAARFWELYGEEITGQYKSLGETECITLRAGKLEWCKYNYGSSMCHPFGEYYRLDQVLAILKRNPQWRLPTGEDWMAFKNADNFTIEQEQRKPRSVTVYCNKTNAVLLFPSVHPERHPVYWVAPSDPTLEGNINGILLYGTCTFLPKKEIIVRAYSEGDDRVSLYGDLDGVRGLLRLVRRE